MVRDDIGEGVRVPCKIHNPSVGYFGGHGPAYVTTATLAPPGAALQICTCSLLTGRDNV
jgi:hypothetical protein